MDKNGNHTDRYGRALAVGTRVQMVSDNELAGEVGTGRVASLPPEGNDYYGFPEVEFDHDGRKRHVADSALLIDERTWVTVTNHHGTFRALSLNVDEAIRRHLPASVADLRDVYRFATDPGGDYSDVRTVGELLVMIAANERA